MRLAILSDIHGNLIALDAVLRDIHAQGPFDQIVVAGDLAWGGPRPREVIDRLVQVNALAVMGNMDAFILGDQSPFYTKESEQNQAHPLTFWTSAQLHAAHLDFLRGLPFSRRFDDLLVVHANPRNLDDALGPNIPDDEIGRRIAGAEARVIAHGHVHINTQRVVDGILLVDVASAGLPRDGDTRAAWDIFEYKNGAWEITPRRVEYDLEAASRDFRESGMPEAEKRIQVLKRARY